MKPTAAQDTAPASRRFEDYYGKSDRPVISFEVFPPKTDKGLENLHALLPELIALNPSFMTVTYGALGTTRDRTVEIASLIRNTYELECACHLTCVGSSRDDLDGILKQIYEAGIRNIVALRGDPPKGESEFVPPSDGYSYGNELVAHIRNFEQERFGGKVFGIAVAGYPEKHVEAPDPRTDLLNLKRKVDAGADVVVTQLFYDNQDYFRFVEDARDIGINVPIIPGLLPVVSAKQIKRITSMCGSKIPEAFNAELEAAGEDEERSQQIGVQQCICQARELLANGAPGIHFYVLNRHSHIQQIMAEIS